jgi:hypothetical protein
MEPKEIVPAVFGAAVGLAGILLVFVGFIYSRVESFDLESDRTKFRRIARSALAPFLLSLISAGLCLNWMLHPSWSVYLWARFLFYASMGLTAVYGVVAFLFYL